MKETHTGLEQPECEQMMTEFSSIPSGFLGFAQTLIMSQCSVHVVSSISAISVMLCLVLYHGDIINEF